MPRQQTKRSIGRTLKNNRFQKNGWISLDSLSVLESKDPTYSNLSSPLIDCITQRLMKNGQKKCAQRLLQKSLKIIQLQTEQDPLLTIEKAIRHTTPSVEIQTRRLRGAVYPIPIELDLERGISRAIRWILAAAQKRSGQTFSIKLSHELIDASKKVGNAFQKKEEVQKIADANARRQSRPKKQKNSKINRRVVQGRE